MSVVISRLADTETVTVEVYAAYDGQGRPTFDSEVEILAHVRRTDAYVIAKDGSKVKTPLTLYVPPGQGLTPGEKDRITLSDGDVFTVAEAVSPRRIGASRSSGVDHTRARCTRGG
jgi:hypothetical protein